MVHFVALCGVIPTCSGNLSNGSPVRDTRPLGILGPSKGLSMQRVNFYLSEAMGHVISWSEDLIFGHAFMLRFVLLPVARSEIHHYDSHWIQIEL
jgi:hypothetical protein